ncbi:MAG: methylated-DNA--[protein]-cysteine S-methyltransferase [Planctomycetota bacterium]
MNAIHTASPRRLPPVETMHAALMARDTGFDGVFYFGVKTTGVFCRPTCAARKPLRQHVTFFASAADALAAGYRACKRCRPLGTPGDVPAWLQPLLAEVDIDPGRVRNDQDLRELGLDPVRVCRWFKHTHGMTFHAYLRNRRLSRALAQLSEGDQVTHVALEAGYGSLSGFREAFQRWIGTNPTAAVHQRVLFVDRISSPLGPLVAAADDKHLLSLDFADRASLGAQMSRLAARLQGTLCPGQNPVLEQLKQQMTEYFERQRQNFAVPTRLIGTDFQTSVWQYLQRIPYGETVSYDALARAIQRPRACRAVGRANGENRLAIVIPCHRVIRADGGLGGYGGGIWRKAWLLSHEDATLK